MAARAPRRRRRRVPARDGLLGRVTMAKVAVLGAGAWGTAMAAVLSGRLEVSLWARDRAQAEAIGRTRRNERYLPGIEVPRAVD
ncbi:MAG TPA: hypothetical protein VGO02_01035, partial [Burkholderiales bacterium]|nr:hypothetical protein [Burkholderiales bacterium]